MKISRGGKVLDKFHDVSVSLDVIVEYEIEKERQETERLRQITERTKRSTALVKLVTRAFAFLIVIAIIYVLQAHGVQALSIATEIFEILP